MSIVVTVTNVVDCRLFNRYVMTTGLRMQSCWTDFRRYTKYLFNRDSFFGWLPYFQLNIILLN